MYKDNVMWELEWEDVHVDGMDFGTECDGDSVRKDNTGHFNCLQLFVN